METKASVTLEEVAKKFTLWRQNKKHRFESPPDGLKADVAKLLPLYRQSQIMAALKVHHGFIKSFHIKRKPCKHKKTSTIQNITPSSLQFIPVGLHNMDPTPLSQESKTINDTKLMANLEIIRPDGMRLIIPTSDPTMAIKAFLCSH